MIVHIYRMLFHKKCLIRYDNDNFNLNYLVNARNNVDFVVAYHANNLSNISLYRKITSTLFIQYFNNIRTISTSGLSVKHLLVKRK